MKITRFLRAVMVVWRLGADSVLDLEKKALYDSLTGAYNRWIFEGVCSKAISQARRYGLSLVLVMADIDLFKELNDQFGHSTGDGVLKSLADALKESVRESDYIFRWGGDEFVMLLLHANREAGEEIIERVNEKIRSISPPVKCSFGIAVWEGEAAGELLEKADAGMYKNKKVSSP